MKDEAQRIAIAKSCGYDLDLYRNGDGEIEIYESTFPDYLNDLNAMRSACIHCVMDDECMIEAFMDALIDLYVKQSGYHWADCWFLADPKLWAEAFLKTIGKWEDEV